MEGHMSQKFEHTPGPWIIAKNGHHDVHDIEAPKSGETVAQHVWANDACLIAAAPDLLAALERIEALDGEGKGWARMRGEYGTIAAADIAKATSNT